MAASNGQCNRSALDCFYRCRESRCSPIGIGKKDIFLCVVILECVTLLKLVEMILAHQALAFEEACQRTILVHLTGFFELAERYLHPVNSCLQRYICVKYQ